MDHAEFHSPDDLLAAATALLDSSNPMHMRMVVLEAITALEAFVHATVFEALQGKLDPLLVRWLEEKTRMDFDARLSVLAPVATGQAVDKKSTLWSDYKKAKEIRNKVTHGARRVSKEEAEGVIKVVRSWLAFLSSTVEIDAALIKFKRRFEAKNEHLPKPMMVMAVKQFFENAVGAEVQIAPQVPSGHRPDLMLALGDRRVVFETKFLEKRGAHTPNIVHFLVQANEQVSRYLQAGVADRAAVVLFFCGLPVPDTLQEPMRMNEGMVSAIGIEVPQNPKRQIRPV